MLCKITDQVRVLNINIALQTIKYTVNVNLALDDLRLFIPDVKGTMNDII
jgi:hypothetical protein